MLHCIRLFFVLSAEKNSPVDKYGSIYHDWKKMLSPITMPSRSVDGAYRK